MFKNIDEALDYLYSFINLEKKSENDNSYKKEYSLDNMKYLVKNF